jgi:S-adenosyl methyltransferase
VIISEGEWAWVDEDDSSWVPPAMDSGTPNVARVYDYLLGGKDHYAVDREFADNLLRAIPDAAETARANRNLLTDAVRTMAQAGVRQFLDLGAGIPTSPNVHETAREIHPDAAVVYVDNDPVVLAHCQALLATEPGLIAVRHDLRDPVAVLHDEHVRSTLDFSRPVGLLMLSVLHFVDQVSAPRIVARYLHELAGNSHVVITIGCNDGVDQEVIHTTQAQYRATSTPAIGRTEAEIAQLFEGVELLPPGLFDCYRSRSARILAGIAVKPAGQLGLID